VSLSHDHPASPGPLPTVSDLFPAANVHESSGAEIIPLPFATPAAAAGYAAYRARRIASMLLQADTVVLAGYAAEFECIAEDLEHAFELPPPGMAS
jgi:hypothetical protein